MIVVDTEKHLVNINVLRIGPFRMSEKELKNLYLFNSDKYKILVDLPLFDQYKSFKEILSVFCDISELTHLIIQLPSSSLLNTVKKLQAEALKG